MGTGKARAASRFHRLRTLRVFGGFLDGLELHFPAGLTCLIGGRGAGKTTVLEFIRYALDQLPNRERDPAGSKRARELIDQNLRGGQVELEIETREGLVYRVSRALWQEPVILTAAGQPTDLALKSGFFKADVYSQNEVESIADRAMAQLDLIDSFEAEGIKELEAKLRQLGLELEANASVIRPVEQQLAGLAEENTFLPGIQQKLREFAGGGGQDAKLINQAYREKAQRERESQALAELAKEIQVQTEDLRRQEGRLAQAVSRHLGPEAAQGVNGGVLRELAQWLRQKAQELNEGWRWIVLALEQAGEQAHAAAAKLKAAHREQELAFQALLAKHKQALEEASERTKLERRQAEMLAGQQKREELAGELKRLREIRAGLLLRLSDCREQRFELRRKVAERINQGVLPHVRMEVAAAGDLEAYERLLEEALKQAHVRPAGPLAGKLARACLPPDLAQLLRTQDAARLIDLAGMSAEQAQRALGSLCGEELLTGLETLELPDLPRIALRDGAEYKASSQLSTGQKCTAILPILLLENESPLLVDQPEDNLDNRFISETILQGIRKVKARRQLIFSTHNPNIPVLAEAERIVVLESDGTRGWAKSGTVDECKAEVVSLLEGGEKAFKERKRRYNY